MFVFVQKGTFWYIIGFGCHGLGMKRKILPLKATFRPGGLAETAPIKSRVTHLTHSSIVKI